MGVFDSRADLKAVSLEHSLDARLKEWKWRAKTS